MQIIRQFIYYFFLFCFDYFESLICLHHFAAGKSLNSHTVLSLPVCTDKVSSNHCQLLLPCWQWRCVPLGLVSSHAPCHLFSGIRCSGAWRHNLSFLVCKFPSCPPILLAASYWVHKLVHQSLRHVRLADDAFLVVLTYGAAQLVVVHCRPILSEPPQSRNVSGVFDFENAFFFIEPANAASIVVRFEQELPEELPEMNRLT